MAAEIARIAIEAGTVARHENRRSCPPPAAPEIEHESRDSPCESKSERRTYKASFASTCVFSGTLRLASRRLAEPFPYLADRCNLDDEIQEHAQRNGGLVSIASGGASKHTIARGDDGESATLFIGTDTASVRKPSPYAASRIVSGVGLLAYTIDYTRSAFPRS